MLDIAAALLVLTALFSGLNQRFLGLPTTIGVMATALGLSLALVGLDALGLATSLHAREAALLGAIDFSELLMQGMLSLLLFAGALHVDARALHAYRWQVGLLAFAGTAASTAVVGIALYGALGGLGLPVPLRQCLLFGALISPTDPIAVIGILKSAGAPRNVEVVIAGESLFNDGVGVVLFTLLLGMPGGGEWPAGPQAADLLHQAASLLPRAAGLLLREAGGGLAYGWVLGQLTRRLLRALEGEQSEVLLTLATVVGGYALANHLQVSGPLAMVVVGLIVGRDRCAPGTPAAGAGDGLPGSAPVAPLDRFWALLDELLNALLFMLVGMQVILIRFPVAPLQAGVAGVAAILVTLGARWLTVGLPVRLFRKAFRLPAGAGGVLTWGGLRGGISIALALSIPAGPHRETLIALTYGVVVFSILVQGLTFARLARARLGR